MLLSLGLPRALAALLAHALEPFPPVHATGRPEVTRLAAATPSPPIARTHARSRIHAHAHVRAHAHARA